MSCDVEENFRIPAMLDYNRNTLFTARDEELKLIHDHLTGANGSTERSSVIKLHGIGGVGKTQLALEYAYLFRDSYESVWWIDAQSPQSIQTCCLRFAQKLIQHYASRQKEPNYTDIARHLGIENLVDDNGNLQLGERPPVLMIDVVKEWLGRDKNDHWLIIFDNLDEVDTFKITDLLPHNLKGNVIITTRNRNVANLGTEVHLYAMPEQAGIELLLKSYRSTNCNVEQSGKALAY